MSYANNPLIFTGTKEEYQRAMARQEIKKRTANLLANIQWRYWLKTEIEIAWPSGWAPLDDSGEVHANTSDPNTWYRWWLEKHAGPQGWAWDWRTGMIHPEVHDTLRIKFRDPKAATMFALKWS